MTAKWLTARQTLELATTNAPPNARVRSMICSRANEGLIKTRAKKYVEGGREQFDQDVPSRFWAAIIDETDDRNWDFGDFFSSIRESDPEPEILYKDAFCAAYGVQFSSADVLVSLGLETTPEGSEPSTEKPKGGRPPAEYWDSLWVEMCRQLYEGELIPRTQADIEDAMQQWILNQGKKASESSVRKRARKLWDVLSEKDKN